MRLFKGLNDIQRALIKKTMKRSYSEKDLMLECARDFGFLVADGEKNGLPVQVAFEAAKSHFKTYGKAMMEFSDLITIEMCPPPPRKESPHDPEARRDPKESGEGDSRAVEESWWAHLSQGHPCRRNGRVWSTEA